MKILYVFGSFGGGGTESHLYSLIKNIKHKDVEASLFIISNEDNFYKKFSDDLDIPVYYLPLKSKFNFPGKHLIKSFFYLLKIMRLQKYDAIHTFFFWGQILGTLSAKITGIKNILSNREDTGFGLSKYHYPILKFANQYTNTIIPIAEYISKIRSKSEKIPENKLHIIYNGIETTKPELSEDKSALLKSLKVTESDFLITTTANLNHPVKGHKYLIEAAKQLKERNINVKFILLGDGRLRPELEKQAAALGVGESVIFLGFRNDVANILAISHIFLLPSLSEGLSIALLEAMRAQLPVIATAVGGTPEVVINNESGLLIKSKEPTQIADAIEVLFNDKPKANMLAKNAYTRVCETFSIENTVNKYYNLYTEFENK